MVRSILSFTLVAGLCAVLPAQADGSRFGQIDSAHRFYQALDIAPDNSAAGTKTAIITELLAADASVELTDFDIVQSRQEFIDSLVELDDALAGSRITHRIDTAEGAGLGVLVCYEFESNAVLNREILTFDNGMISVVTQTPIADNCDAL